MCSFKDGCKQEHLEKTFRADSPSRVSICDELFDQTCEKI